MKLCEVTKTISWEEPNFDEEYNEVKHQGLDSYFKTKAKWIKIAKTGKKTALTKSQINDLQNHTADKSDWKDIEDAKRDRVEEQFARGKVELPIVLYDSESEMLYLLAGNTRLNYSNNRGFGRFVWMVQTDDLENYM